MYSQCPQCLTIHLVTVADLGGGRGRAVCGSCGEIFDVLATLSNELPPEPIEQLDYLEAEMPLPTLRQPILRPKSRQPSLLDVAARSPSDGFLRRQSAPATTLSPRRRLRWWFGAAALALMLLFQVLYAERDYLLSIPTYRAWAASACRMLGCELPSSEAAVEGLALVSRDIRKHPTVEGALLISATLANQSQRARPYPVLELRLSDLEERPVAMRRFAPADYVSDSARIPAGMPPGTSLPVEFEVIDPGPQAVAFEFRFLAAD
jgi:predicted Zn finger-like uncharacterized protein